MLFMHCFVSCVYDNDNLIIIKPLLLIQNVFALKEHGVRSGIRAQ
jgi:hypothetical protein